MAGVGGTAAARCGRRSSRRRTTTAPSSSFILSSAAALMVLLLAARHAQGKGLDVTLKARWEGTSFVLEAAEFLVSTLR